MGESDWFFKFMCELGTSGVWAKLSEAAKAIYPMLGIHTDGTFKPVFPSLTRLSKLTGLSRQGVLNGLRDLESHGLIVIRSGRSRTKGKGNRTNIYEFSFQYAGSTLVNLVDQPLSTSSTTLSTGQTTPGQPARREQDRREQKEREQQQQEPRPIHLNLTLQQDQSIAAAALDLLKRYFDEDAARRLAAQYPPDYIQEKINFVERRAKRSRLRNKPGYLRRALEDGWETPGAERDTDQFDELLQAVTTGDVRDALIGGVPWRAGVTADRKSIYLTHLTSGAQMRLNDWPDCQDIEWK